MHSTAWISEGWIDPARRMPPKDLRVLVAFVREYRYTPQDGSTTHIDRTVGHWSGEYWELDTCGVINVERIIYWAEMPPFPRENFSTAQQKIPGIFSRIISFLRQQKKMLRIAVEDRRGFL